jgi:4,5-DOPA dioxygenase extradiol
MPVLFLSHGAPTLALEAGETGTAWRQIAAQLAKPSAILVVSAHWETNIPTVSRAVLPGTIHDFSGFSEALYKLRYPAPGAPKMAEETAQALRQAGIQVALDDTRGLDHGAWIPLSLMFPGADIPVAQLSIQPEQSPAWHIELGRALRPLREQGVLIVCSGAITHNLRAIFQHPQGEPAPAWVGEFCDWIAGKIAAGDIDALSNYRALAPHAMLNHPTDEHLLPLFVALGAARRIDNSQRINHVMTYGLLAMDAWLFDARVVENI